MFILTVLLLAAIMISFACHVAGEEGRSIQKRMDEFEREKANAITGQEYLVDVE